MNEIWKPVKGYERKYEISNFGNIKALNFQGHGFEKLKKPTLNKEGYFCIMLWKDSKPKLFKIHRLVAEAFIPNIENKPQVDHINTIRTDNRVDNLRWVTNFENSRNEHTYKRISENGKRTIKYAREACKKKVMCIETKTIYNSVKEAAMSIKVTPSSFTTPLRVSHRTVKGFHWKYYNE